MSGVSKFVAPHLLLVVTLALGGNVALANESPTVDAATKSEVVDKVAELVTDLYVFEEIGAKMGAHVRARYDNGEYDGLHDLKGFCRKLTADLRQISHDKHIFVFYSPEEAREVAARKGLLPAEEIVKVERESYEMSRRKNFGFDKIEILQGNVGYLKLDSFSAEEQASKVAAAAMTFLSSTDAIVIDLRENGGGGGDLLQLLASYFFDSSGVPLTGVYYRSSGETVPVQTLPHVPGERRANVDLYLLTSSRTFSAAEDFCYSLKHLERARIVGEVTKGGAHPVDVLIVTGSILTQLSIGNSVNPVTNSNWEGVGVQPDIPVPAEKALQTAHLAALQGLLDRAAGDRLRAELKAAIERVE